MLRFKPFIVAAVLLLLMVGCGPAIDSGANPDDDGPPRPVPTQPTVAPTPARLTSTSPCPTDDQMFAAHSFDAKKIKAVATGGGISWEGCKWNIQAVGIGLYDQPMLPDYQYTVTLDDGNQMVAVFYGGPNLTRKVMGATIRFRPAYNTPDNRWVNDPCELLKREHAFGQAPERGSLTYPTTSGNVTCGTTGGSGQSARTTGTNVR